MFEKKCYEDKKTQKNAIYIYYIGRSNLFKALEARKLSSQEALNAGGKGKVIKIVI